MQYRINPCYRCEHRTVTCRLECSDWKAYCEERDKKYVEDQKQRDAEQGYIGYVGDVIQKIEERKCNHKP